MKDHDTDTWSEYNELPPGKKEFLVISNTIQSYLDKTSESLLFTIAAPIVDTIIGDLFFSPEDDEEDYGMPAIGGVKHLFIWLKINGCFT